MSSAAFGQTLQYITSIKLTELERQRSACQQYVTKALDTATAIPEPLERVNSLLDAIRNWNGIGKLVSAELRLETYDAWVHQARSDSSISREQIEGWALNLERQLRQAVIRYDYAKLFGDLLEEWLKSGDSLALAENSPGAAETQTKAFREERIREQEMIEKVIFSSKTVDVAAIQKYLEDLFSSTEAAAALSTLRSTITTFAENFRKQRVDEDDMRQLIKSLLVRDLLTPEKNATLKNFLDSNTILEEVASVLNMQMASLDTWSWPEEGVAIEMRRELSGKYRAYMDTEIVQALLVQYIGMHFSVTFKSALRAVTESRAWATTTRILNRSQLKRREVFLNEKPAATIQGRGRGGRGGRRRGDWGTSTATTIEAQRQELRSSSFFMTRLPSQLEEEDPYTDDPKPESKANTGLNSAQELLRLIWTEAHLSKSLYEKATIMRADLQLFGPSLSHDAMLTILKFFGVPEDWLGFFKRWLTAPLRFPGKETRIRTCGVPIAHALSVLFGEVLLFGMDFAVNQRTHGLYVYRIYDDFWYIHHDSALCATAWAEMNKYANLVGINFNMKKTGGVCVGGELDSSLPRGSVGWGFLTLDGEQGRFVIDQSNVDLHIQELKRQVANAKSVFGFVNAYNKYMGFFRRNFAQPAHCFGQVHADEITSTLARIQREVFASSDQSVVRQVQAMIEERFGIKDIPAGWCFMPVSEGGLEIANPIIDTLLLRNQLKEDPSSVFPNSKKRDVDEYESAKERWLNGVGEGTAQDSVQDFMSFEEFILGREAASKYWGDAWRDLQRTVTPGDYQSIAVQYNAPDWWERSNAEKWIIGLYGEELVNKFGTIRIVEPTLIPTGMLSAFRNAKIAWDA